MDQKNDIIAGMNDEFVYAVKIVDALSKINFSKPCEKDEAVIAIEKTFYEYKNKIFKKNDDIRIMNNIDVKIFNKGKNPLPEYSKKGDAGFDLRADFSHISKKSDFIGNGNYSLKQTENDNYLILYPRGRIVIPTGLHVSMPDGFEIQVRPRSGQASRNGISVLNSPGTVDEGYLGEIGVILLNTNDVEFFIYQGDRIAQGVAKEVWHCNWDKVDKLEDLGETERGQGGFGHTGDK